MSAWVEVNCSRNHFLKGELSTKRPWWKEGFTYGTRQEDILIVRDGVREWEETLGDHDRWVT
jgi:hypothetical protein